MDFDDFFSAQETGESGFTSRLDFNGKRGMFEYEGEQILPTKQNPLVLTVDMWSSEYGYREWVPAVDENGTPTGKLKPQDTKALFTEPMPAAPESFGKKNAEGKPADGAAKLAVFFTGEFEMGEFTWCAAGPVQTSACKDFLAEWNKAKATKDQVMELRVTGIGEFGTYKNPMPIIEGKVVEKPKSFMAAAPVEESAGGSAAKF